MVNKWGIYFENLLSAPDSATHGWLKSSSSSWEVGSKARLKHGVSWCFKAKAEAFNYLDNVMNMAFWDVEKEELNCYLTVYHTHSIG